jgi:hypothetical protein
MNVLPYSIGCKWSLRTIGGSPGRVALRKIRTRLLSSCTRDGKAGSAMRVRKARHAPCARTPEIWPLAGPSKVGPREVQNLGERAPGEVQITHS